MLNEKKRDGRRGGWGDPFALIWYGNISCSHTRRGYENKRLGDGGDTRKRGGLQGVGRSREMFSDVFQKERRWKREERWRKPLR